MYLPSNGRVGKQIRPTSVEALSAGCFTSSRLHITDRTTGWTFLINTGADICILLAKYLPKLAKLTQTLLFAANGDRIKTYGEKQLTLNLGLRRPIK